MIYNYLKRNINYYLISGLALCIVIFGIFLLVKYEKSLSDAVAGQENIRNNMVKMEQAIRDMDSLVKKMNILLPKDYNHRSHQELLLFALDDIKTIFKGSEITVTRFEEQEGELFLPVTIKFYLDDYSMLLRRIGYLQSLKFPHFTIKNVNIGEATDKQTKVIICIIEGLLKMPAQRLGEIKS